MYTWLNMAAVQRNQLFPKAVPNKPLRAKTYDVFCHLHLMNRPPGKMLCIVKLHLLISKFFRLKCEFCILVTFLNTLKILLIWIWHPRHGRWCIRWTVFLKNTCLRPSSFKTSVMESMGSHIVHCEYVAFGAGTPSLPLCSVQRRN